MDHDHSFSVDAEHVPMVVTEWRGPIVSVDETGEALRWGLSKSPTLFTLRWFEFDSDGMVDARKGWLRDHMEREEQDIGTVEVHTVRYGTKVAMFTSPPGGRLEVQLIPRRLW